jgi:hypothetical protein
MIQHVDKSTIVHCGGRSTAHEQPRRIRGKSIGLIPVTGTGQANYLHNTLAEQQRDWQDKHRKKANSSFVQKVHDTLNALCVFEEP